MSSIAERAPPAAGSCAGYGGNLPHVEMLLDSPVTTGTDG
jgi:hypothetical protein